MRCCTKKSSQPWGPGAAHPSPRPQPKSVGSQRPRSASANCRGRDVHPESTERRVRIHGVCCPPGIHGTGPILISTVESFVSLPCLPDLLYDLSPLDLQLITIPGSGSITVRSYPRGLATRLRWIGDPAGSSREMDDLSRHAQRLLRFYLRYVRLRRGLGLNPRQRFRRRTDPPVRPTSWPAADSAPNMELTDGSRWCSDDGPEQGADARSHRHGEGTPEGDADGARGHACAARARRQSPQKRQAEQRGPGHVHRQIRLPGPGGDDDGQGGPDGKAGGRGKGRPELGGPSLSEIPSLSRACAPNASWAISWSATCFARGITSPQALRALVAIAEQSPGRLCREILGDGWLCRRVGRDSGVGAVMAVRERLPQLILIDLRLRDVSGREAIGWLRSNPALQLTPIIVLVGGSEEERMPSAPQPGTTLRKPLSPEAIRRAIHQVLRPAL